MPSGDDYAQHLPAIKLSLVRNCDPAPHDGRFYLFRDGEVVGTFKRLKEAKAAWEEAVAASGWQPEARELDPAEVRERAIAIREAERYEQYWGSSHKFRR
jgi:hypothetical protein